MNSSALPAQALKGPAEQLLETLLADVRAGKITTVGVVAIGAQGGYVSVWAGSQAGDLYIGAGSLQKKILDAIETPQKAPTILRARPAG